LSAADLTFGRTCPTIVRLSQWAKGCFVRLLLLADAVEKVENRTTPKISQMVIFGLFRRCDAL
jgi:hypothetical protein